MTDWSAITDDEFVEEAHRRVNQGQWCRVNWGKLMKPIPHLCLAIMLTALGLAVNNFVLMSGGSAIMLWAIYRVERQS